MGAHSLLKESGIWRAHVRTLCVCVCVAIVGMNCLRQALCQVRDEHSWLSCWAHLYNYTFVQKACFSNVMNSPLGLWLRLCMEGEERVPESVETC